MTARKPITARLWVASFLVDTIAGLANDVLDTLFPTAPDDTMAIAQAAGVTVEAAEVRDAERRAQARAAAAKRAQSPAMQRTPAPWFTPGYEELRRREVELLAEPAIRDADAEIAMRWQLGQDGAR